jgi:CBS domain-containing protein
MKVAEIMHAGVITVKASDSLPLVAQLFLDEGITGTAVVDEQGQPVGVISMSDLTAHALGSRADEIWPDPKHLEEMHFEQGVSVGDVMTDLIIRVDAEDSVKDLLEIMKVGRLHRVFVTRDDELVGIVTTLDLVLLLERLLS